MDEFPSNYVEYNDSSDDMADDRLIVDISVGDENLHDPIKHPQQEDQVEESNIPTQTLNSELSGQCMANTNHPILRTLLSRRDDSRPDAPGTSGMMTSESDLQSPNESLVCQPTKPNLQQMYESEEMQAFAKAIRNKRMLLGYSREKMSSKLNELCRLNNRDEIFSEACIECFEMQNMNLDDMLKLKPMLNCWLKVSSDENDSLRSRHRKTATSLEVLEKTFQKNPLPSSQEIDNLTIQLNMKRTSVYAWFVSRRRREKLNKQSSHTTNHSMPLGTSSDSNPVTRTDSKHSSLKAIDFVFRARDAKPPIATTGKQDLGKDVPQNFKPVSKHTGMLPKPIPMNKKVMMARSKSTTK